MKSLLSLLAVGCLLTVAYACTTSQPKGVETDPAVRAQRAPQKSFDDRVEDHVKRMLDEGKKIFRYDTFGSEDFWGGQLRLHEAIAGEKLGGVGPGVSARQALQFGLKVDISALPSILLEALRTRAVDLDRVETTQELLRANAVVGVTGVYHDGRFADLNDVVEHYSRVLRLSLTEAERTDLVQFLKSL